MILPPPSSSIFQAPAKIQLANWRSTIFDLYSDIRRTPVAERETVWHQWRDTRDDLFWNHPQTPLNAQQQAAATEVAYFGYDEAWRKIGRIVESPRATLNPDVPHDTIDIQLPEGNLNMTRIAHVSFDHAAQTHTLGLYWINGYGGGLFLPFRDLTNNQQTYGGGRYLYDSIKGADLGRVGDDLILDFNFAYNPSCAYNDQWVCPLAPQENHLQVAVEAGEFGAGH